MTNSVRPVVSIIMATYNRALLITETLKSIQRQSFEEWECLIIDDGSTDDTAVVVNSFIDSDPRFRYYKRGNQHKKGLPGCRNDGLNRAKGDYVIFFDDDDIVHPMNLEICVSELIEKSMDFCRYERKVFTGNFEQQFDLSSVYSKKLLDRNNVEEIVKGQIPFNSCQVMWKKECFENNQFNEDLMYAEEWECYLRILSSGFTGVTVDKILFFGRKHPQSNTGEFWNNDPVRRESKVTAAKLVIDNLEKEALLNKSLTRYFVQLGIFLKDKSILTYVLEKAGVGYLQKTRYSLLYDLYPVIVLGHRAKKTLKKQLL